MSSLTEVVQTGEHKMEPRAYVRMDRLNMHLALLKFAMGVEGLFRCLLVLLCGLFAGRFLGVAVC